MLSGMQTEELVLHPYLAEAPTPPTNNEVFVALCDQLLAKWEDRELRVNADIIGILDSLGICQEYRNLHGIKSYHLLHQKA